MIAFSTICYMHGKVLGLEQASKVLQAQVMGQEVRGAPPPLAVTTCRRLGEAHPLEEITVRLDPNGSSLGKARARALHWAWQTGADVWVSCDDDVTASVGTLTTLVRLVREAPMPRVVVVPCALRGDVAGKAQVNVVPDRDWRYTESHPDRKLLCPLKWGGFGLVAMNRPALVEICDRRPNWLDSDGQRPPLVFNCEVTPGLEWLGEDFSFFEQTRDLVEAAFLIRGESDHAGASIDLADVGALFEGELSRIP